MNKLTKLNIRWVIILALVGGLLCALPVMAEEKETPPDLLEPDAIWDPVSETWLNPEEAIEAEEEAALAGSQDDQEYIGETLEDWVYTAVNPCIIVDTRKVGGPIFSGFTRGFNVYGNLAGSQGGASCSLPSGKYTPRAVHINLIAIPVSGGNGNIRAYPDGAPTSDGLSVNFNSGLPVALANAGTVKTNTGAGYDIRVKTNYANANVKIEVLGYYFNSQSVVGGDYTNSSGSSHTLSTTDLTVKSLSMYFDVPGEVLVIGNGHFYFGSATTSNAARCSVESGTTITSSQAVACDEWGGNSLDYCPITVTRTFYVGTGNYTFRLICDEQSGSVTMRNPRIHAIFYQRAY